MRKYSWWLGGGVGAFLLAGLMLSPATRAAEEKAPATQPAAKYPLATCPVSGEKLGGMGKPVAYKHEGREVQFCCAGCTSMFKKEPAKYLAKMDAEIVKAQGPKYPLKACVVSGDPLPALNDKAAVNHVHTNNQLVRLCCPPCVKTFNKEPAKYLKQIDEAAKQAATTQPAARAEDSAKTAHACPMGAEAKACPMPGS